MSNRKYYKIKKFKYFTTLGFSKHNRNKEEDYLEI